MKKQLLIAAVAATMATATMADVSISGGSKINFTSSETTGAATTNVFKHDIDLTVAGKTGATGVTLTVSNANSANDQTHKSALTVENAFVTSQVGDLNIKMGQWADTSDSLLSNQTSVFNSGNFSVDTTIGGVNIAFDDANANDASVTVSGDVSGVSLSHEVGKTTTDTKINAEVAGISIAYRVKGNDIANSDKTSLQLSKDFNGMTFTYASIDADSAVTVDADGYIGGSAIKEANAFGVKMDVAGNTVQAKRISITDAAGDDKSTKLYLTRKLASGATFEAVYTDTDNAVAADTSSLDLELAVKF